jgi:hypothetical protein
MTAEEALCAIEIAPSYKHLFAPTGVDERYRELLILVHPDKFFTSYDQERATKASARLGEFYAQASGKTPQRAVVLGKWIVESPFAKGDVADLYTVTFEKFGTGVVKIARAASDNDLMEAEAKALREIEKWWRTKFKSDKPMLYIPELLDTFQASGRRANVLRKYSEHVSLAAIRKMIPGGVPFRHIVWMMNRLLSAIGHTERAEFIHGGITPDHLLYHPEEHGLVLVGWCSVAKVAAKEPVKIVADAWKNLYPEEVRRKFVAGAGTNIYMAAKCMRWAAESIPARFRALLDWCTAESPSARPRDAWELQDLWRLLAEEEYGKPRYVKLELPKR